MVNEQHKQTSYRIELHTETGLYSKTNVDNWADCLSLVRALARAEPAMTVRVVRIEELDSAELEQVEQAVREARGG